MKAIALLMLSSAISAGAGAHDASASVADIGNVVLNPPLDQPMLLTISDQRQLANGGTATFSIAHRLSFMRDGSGGWRVQVVQDSLDCHGPDALCSTYRAFMAPGIGLPRVFRIWSNGSIDLLSPAQRLVAPAPAPGSTDTNAAMIVEATELESPSLLNSGELREALRFVGQPIAELDNPTSQPGRQNAVRDFDAGTITLVEQKSVSSDNVASVSQTIETQLDLATGLVSSSRTETMVRGADGAASLISTRRWQLARMAGTGN